MCNAASGSTGGATGGAASGASGGAGYYGAANAGLSALAGAWVASRSGGVSTSALNLSNAQAAGASANRKSQATMQARAMDLQALIADLNAKAAEGDARATFLAGEREVQKSQIQTANIKSKQRAALAANGVDLGVGSAENILTSTDVLGEIDANTIEANASRAAWGHRIRGASFAGQAIMASASAEATRGQSLVQDNIDSRAFAFNKERADSISPNKAIFTALLKGGKDYVDAGGWGTDESRANSSTDPIYELGSKRGWWSKYK